MNKSQYQTITLWQDKTFTKATPLSCVNHLLEEVQELKTDIEAGKYSLDEIADCYLLLFGVSNKCGLTYEDVVQAIWSKMEVNYARKWAHDDIKGYAKHIVETNMEDEADEKEFEPCAQCDGHDACEDFGCAIDNGLGNMLAKNPTDL